VSSKRLLAILGLHYPALDRAYVTGTLCPETLEVQAAVNLRTALWRLHSVPDGVMTVNAVNLALHPDVDVDVRALEAVVHGLLHETEDLDLCTEDPQGPEARCRPRGMGALAAMLQRQITAIGKPHAVAGRRRAQGHCWYWGCPTPATARHGSIFLNAWSPPPGT
jgi:hypothetical protein